MSTGKLIVITGPSGVGKGTIVRSLLASNPRLSLSISATTRKPRPGEIEGRDYYFVDRHKFELMIENDKLLEWAEYAGNYYGTPKDKVEKTITLGKWPLLEIEIVGARAIKQIYPSALRIFILPPSLAELERRLRSRGKDSEEAIIRRLARAEAEISASQEFAHCIINDDLSKTIKKVEEIIFSNAT
ncbi:MAG: guanylate kinase [Xenococcaceae cyanobacterium MO_188.B32]|nr:guanylate kinase [Xenococcaceae cyanobacterium MO_188.B32]